MIFNRPLEGKTEGLGSLKARLEGVMRDVERRYVDVGDNPEEGISIPSRSPHGCKPEALSKEGENALHASREEDGADDLGKSPDAKENDKGKRSFDHAAPPSLKSPSRKRERASISSGKTRIAPVSLPKSRPSSVSLKISPPRGLLLAKSPWVIRVAFLSVTMAICLLMLICLLMGKMGGGRRLSVASRRPLVLSCGCGAGN